MKAFLYAILIIQTLSIRLNNNNSANANNFFIEHQNERDVQNSELCSPNDLEFLKSYYIDNMFLQNISLLTSFKEINNKMCHKMVFKRSPSNIYLYQIHLNKTEFFETNQTCIVALQFKQNETEQQSKVLIEEDGQKYLQRVPLTFGPYVRKQRCTKFLKDEKDFEFEKRLRKKLEDKNFHNKIKFQMTKKIQQEPETFASTVLVPNQQLKDALSKEAYVKVLYEQFNCFPMRLEPFQNVINDKEEQVKEIVGKYLQQTQPLFQKIYQEQTKQFQMNLQNQLAEKMTQMTTNNGVHMFMDQISPDTKDNLTQGIAQAVVGFLFQAAFQVGTKVVGSIVNNTVGRIYRGIAGFVNRKHHLQRNFKFCFNFEKLKIDEILQQKVHSILNYEVKQQDLEVCLAEQIEINNALLGYELRMQINSPNGLCQLNLFVNTAGIINYLQPNDEDVESCASFDKFTEGNQLASLVDISPDQTNKINDIGTSVDPVNYNQEGSSVDPLNYVHNPLDQLQSHPLQFDHLDLEDLDIRSDSLSKGFQIRDDIAEGKFRLI